MLDARRGKKKQKISHTKSTNDFKERYLMLKKEEIGRFATKEENKIDFL
jgi:hypothetical protein